MVDDFSIKLEFKPQDLWFGIFWKRNGNCLDVWICLIPCFPIHFSCWGLKWGMPSIDQDDRPPHPFRNCKHDGGLTVRHDHLRCHKCLGIKTDSCTDWGVARNRWFVDLHAAKYYRDNGKTPK